MVIVTFRVVAFLGQVILQFSLIVVCSFIDPPDHRCDQLGSGDPPTRGQLCSYWRICFGFSSGVRVSDTPPFWMG